MNLRLPSASAAELTHSSSAASSSGGPMSMLQRAALFEDRVKPVADEDGATSLPDTKWGRCMRADCGYALSPHLYASGQFAGQIRLLCNRFKKVQDGKRMFFFRSCSERQMVGAAQVHEKQVCRTPCQFAPKH